MDGRCDLARVTKDAPNDGAIHTVVSQPGPAEARLLETAPFLVARRHVAAGRSLRTLETARGERPLALLVHGRGHAASLWIPVARELCDLLDLVLVDVPGYGHSAFTPPASPTQDAALDAFAAPIEALARELAPDLVVGHSLGGLIALRVALTLPAPPRGLVLIGSMGLSEYAEPRARAYLHLGPERLARVRRWLPTPSLSGATSGEIAAVRQELLRAPGAARAKPTFDRLLPLRGPACSLAARLGEVACPTLLLWGERDEAFPVPIALDARTKLRAAQLVVLPTGHSPHLEQPARVAEEITRFSKSLL